jgi:hypothetical protein
VEPLLCNLARGSNALTGFIACALRIIFTVYRILALVVLARMERDISDDNYRAIGPKPATSVDYPRFSITSTVFQRL